MKWAVVGLALVSAASAVAGSGQEGLIPGREKPEAMHETKAQHDVRMRWWREARFGMFIHWGLYSIPAGQWNGHTEYAEWLREEAHIPVDQYEKLQPQFNPVKFDADKWVRMARDAGMRYVTITTKHHDGFNLFDSDYTNWSIAGTPFYKTAGPKGVKEPKGRDVMKEMAAACKRYGLKMCWYHSIMDWHHPDYLPRRSWEGGIRPVDAADMDRYVEYLHNEVKQLLTNYGDIGVMWFDGEWEPTWNSKYGESLYDLCRQVQPNVIVNNRVSVGSGDNADEVQAGDYSTPEQFIPPTGLPGVDWETCMTMNDHWGYNSHDKNWKSSETLIRNVADIASKGGNYLLNIGPMADGEFPPEAVQRLKDIGKWMRVNGDSIYDTQASVFDDLPWGRSTTRRYGDQTALFLQVFAWPIDDRLVVPGIGNKVKGAKLLATGAHLGVSREGADLVIDIPHNPPDKVCSVIELDVEGEPVIYRAPQILAESDILVNNLPVSISSGSGELQVRYTTDGSEPTAASTLYASPFSIDGTSTVRAASFHNGQRVSAIAEMAFTKVAPKPAAVVNDGMPGVTVSVYDGEWDSLPDFGKLTPRAQEVSAVIGLPNLPKPEEHVGRLINGYIVVPEDGVFRFALTSDDGSRLWIDDELVVDNDGLHSATTKMGRAALQQGAHRFKLGYFNKTGGADLRLDWGAVGQRLHRVDPSELTHGRG